MSNLSPLLKFFHICIPTHCSVLFLTLLETAQKNKANVASFLTVSLLPSVHLSPLGVEAQSPPIAAGHRSLCPWRRQPTYCQLPLKWRAFHHPTENTIKTAHPADGSPQEPTPVAGLVTLSAPHPLRYLLPPWLSACQLKLGKVLLRGASAQTRHWEKEQRAKQHLTRCARLSERRSLVFGGHGSSTDC